MCNGRRVPGCHLHRSRKSRGDPDHAVCGCNNIEDWANKYTRFWFQVKAAGLAKEALQETFECMSQRLDKLLSISYQAARGVPPPGPALVFADVAGLSTDEFFLFYLGTSGCRRSSRFYGVSGVDTSVFKPSEVPSALPCCSSI